MRSNRLQARTLAAAGIAIGLFVIFWILTHDASLTHDEVVYIDIAQHPFSSNYYPGETFLRHPPLGLAMLAGWETMGLMARAWPLPWVLGGLVFLASGIDARDGSRWWLLVPVLASPALVPLLTVTLYPPLFFFLSLAAWGWATRRRWAEVVGWNLAAFTHELALLLLAVTLMPRIARRWREQVTDLREWLDLVWPYPAALATGSMLVWNLFAGSDARGGWVLSALFDPSPNLAAILEIKPFVSLVLAIAIAPLLVRPDEDASPTSRGLTYASVVAILAAPFYRYALALVPMLVVLRAARPPDWFDERGPTLLVAGCLVASGLAIGATVTGTDTLNAATLPGLVDHDQAKDLVQPGDRIVVRSPLSFAHVLRDEGWRLTGTAPSGPAHVNLTRGGEDLTLYRAETIARVQQFDGVDGVVFPSTWRTLPGDLPGGAWTENGTADRMVRWEPD